jgi:FkbM family methyltransferase
MKKSSSLKVNVEFDFKLRHKFISQLNDIDMKGFRKLTHAIPKWLISPPKRSGVIQLPNGLKLWIDPENDDGVERSLYYTGTYEAGTLDFIENNLKPGDCFVDIGANIGLMSIVASMAVGDEGEIYSFEPHPETAKILRFNIDLNAISNIKVIQKGVGSENGQAKIYDRWDVNRGGASFIASNSKQDSYDVEIVRLDDVLSSISIDMIKIDIEGFELEALKGAKNIIGSEKPPILIVECTQETEHQEYSREELYFWLKNTNSKYKFFKLKGSKSRRSKLIEIADESDLPTHDNLFCIPED